MSGMNPLYHQELLRERGSVIDSFEELEEDA